MFEENLPNSRSLINLQPGMLLIHGLQRPLGLSNSLELAMLFRMIHPNITNTARFNADELVVPGPRKSLNYVNAFCMKC